jgi:hypothetical protein
LLPQPHPNPRLRPSSTPEANRFAAAPAVPEAKASSPPSAPTYVYVPPAPVLHVPPKEIRAHAHPEWKPLKEDSREFREIQQSCSNLPRCSSKAVRDMYAQLVRWNARISQAFLVTTLKAGAVVLALSLLAWALISPSYREWERIQEATKARQQTTTRGKEYTVSPVVAQTRLPSAVTLESELATALENTLQCITDLEKPTSESIDACKSATIKRDQDVTPDMLQLAIDSASKCRAMTPKDITNPDFLDCAQDVAHQVVSALGPEAVGPPPPPVPQAPPAEKQGRMYMGATVYGPDPWRKPQSAITFMSKMCNEVSDRECANAYDVFTLCNAYSTAEPPPDTSTREAMTEGINLKFQACMHEYMQ